MELRLKRKEFTENSTIGELYVDGIKECWVVEDKDRGLNSSMSEEQIGTHKVYGVTAIPKGKYQVVLSFSNRFQKYLPELIGVKGFAGIRIHSGNTAADSLGCLIVGQTKAANFVGNSRLAFDALFKKLKVAEKKEKIYIIIE